MENKISFEYFCELTGIEFKQLSRLAEVPGCKLYHLEGDALKHTKMVYDAMHSLTDNPILLKTAVLHDIGKFETVRYNKERQTFEYPNHAKTGALVLKNYYNQWNKDFKIVQWLIENHIKPLFPNWQSKLSPLSTELDKDTAIKMLAMLVWCDLQGSIHEDSVDLQQMELKESLRRIFDTEDNNLLRKREEYEEYEDF